MDPTELLSVALARLADAVGDLLRHGADPRAYVLTAADPDTPLGELLRREDGGTADAACIMLPVDTLARLLEGRAFDGATAERIATWLAMDPGPERYRMFAIARAGMAALTLDTTGEGDDADDDRVAHLLRH